MTYSFQDLEKIYPVKSANELVSIFSIKPLSTEPFLLSEEDFLYIKSFVDKKSSGELLSRSEAIKYLGISYTTFTSMKTPLPPAYILNGSKPFYDLNSLKKTKEQNKSEKEWEMLGQIPVKKAFPKKDLHVVLSDAQYLDINIYKHTFYKESRYYITIEDIPRMEKHYQTASVAERKEAKRKKTCLDKYGAINNSCTEEWREKVRATNLAHWGVENPAQSSLIKNKMQQSCRNKYGVASTNSLQWKKDKIKATVQDRYGVDHVSQNASIKEKATNTYKNRYGEFSSENLLHPVHKSLATRQSHKQLEKESLEKLYNTKLYSIIEVGELLDRDIATLRIFLAEKEVPIVRGALGLYISEADFLRVKIAYDLRKSTGISEKEKEVLEFVRSIYDGNILENTKTVIPPKELDIYLPDVNFAIEFDGLYFHSDATRDRNLPSEQEQSIAKARHLDKTNACINKGIYLLHIFEDDWDKRQSIIKSIIRNALGKNETRIYARDCTIKELDKTTYKNFLERNHLQGFAYSDVRVGLFFKNDLVQVIGINSKGNHAKSAELVRMAVCQNTSVLGGFTKLLAYVDRVYSFETLISYIDRSIFKGEGYNRAGFSILYHNSPTYFYVKGTNRYPRYMFTRKNIENKYRLGKLSYWNKDESEKINMYKNGYFRIWNCGTTVIERYKQF